MRWDVVDIVEGAFDALAKAARDCDAEQAVYGIDALAELGLHPIIQRGLRDAGFGVRPEQAFPSALGARKRKSEGKRCDIVLIPDGASLVDPEAEATLFSPDDAVPLEAAYWLEIKTVSQFTTDGPFARYSAELLSPVRQDIRKLAQDPMIFHAGLLLVLFTIDRPTAEHDLKIWEEQCLKRAFPVAPPIVRDMPITDRLGNAHMTVALFPIRRL
ncbi:MAG: hypothetical protein GC162_09815 [Planctomycetes bacterium]|nr:hypothetical protein [Planctomycetota bacterium]